MGGVRRLLSPIRSPIRNLRRGPKSLSDRSRRDDDAALRNPPSNAADRRHLVVEFAVESGTRAGRARENRFRKNIRNVRNRFTARRPVPILKTVPAHGDRSASPCDVGSIRQVPSNCRRLPPGDRPIPKEHRMDEALVCLGYELALNLPGGISCLRPRPTYTATAPYCSRASIRRPPQEGGLVGVEGHELMRPRAPGSPRAGSPRRSRAFRRFP